MSSTHREHAAELERSVLGAHDMREALAGSPLAGCRQCRAEVDALLAVRDGLDELGRFQRELERSSVGMEEDEAFVRSRIETDVVVPRSGVRRYAYALVAAVLVAVGGWWLTRTVPDEARAVPQLRLGSGQDSEAAPVGEVNEWTKFTWSMQPPVGGFLRIRVYDSDGNDLCPPVRLESGTTSWTPPDDTSKGFPARILWDLGAFDAGNQLVRSELYEAWLAPR